MATLSATITYQRGHKRETTYLPFVVSSVELGLYAAKLQGLTKAGIQKYAYTETEDVNYAESLDPIEDVSVEAHVMLKLDPPNVGDKSLNNREVVIPAPDMGIFEFLDGQGYRVKQTVGDEIALAYSQLTGRTYVFTQGWLCGGTW